jgi:hypothetical protein
MESRSTFLHHLRDVITMGRRRRIGIRAIGNARPPGRGSRQANPVALNLERGGEGCLRASELADSTLPRKSSKESFR